MVAVYHLPSAREPVRSNYRVYVGYLCVYRCSRLCGRSTGLISNIPYCTQTCNLGGSGGVNNLVIQKLKLQSTLVTYYAEYCLLKFVILLFCMRENASAFQRFTNVLREGATQPSLRPKAGVVEGEGRTH